MQANLANCADAIMLDLEGFVAETNATNVFAMKNGVIMTPSAVACLPGLTRNLVVELAKKAGYEVREDRISLSEFYTADEVFTTGTMGGLAHVKTIDGRLIGNGEKGPITKALQSIYDQAIWNDAIELTKPISDEGIEVDQLLYSCHCHR